MIHQTHKHRILAACLTLSVAQMAQAQSCDVTWRKADNPHVISNTVTIPANQTVCVEAGVQVQFTSQGQLQLLGALVGDGVAADRISFTSANVYPNSILVKGTLDLSFVDIGVPLNVGAVDPSDTGTLLLQNSRVLLHGQISGGLRSFVSFDNVLFDSSDPVGSFNAAFTGSSSSAIFRNVTFQNRAYFIATNSFLYLENLTSLNSATDGLSIGGNFLQPIYLNTLSVANSVGAGLVLSSGNFELGSNNVIQNAEYPMRGDGGLLPGSQVPATGNRNNWVAATAGVADTIYAPIAVPYVMDGFSGGLSLLPGVDIKLRANAAFSTFSGTLRALGLPNAPITIEPFIPGQKWKSGQFNSQGDRLDYVTLDGSELGIVNAGFNGAAYYIDNSVITNHDRAIMRQDFAASYFQGNLFTRNGTAIEADQGTHASGLTNPNLFENNVTAMTAPFGSNPDARYNWWNSPTGPTAPNNPGGSGEVIAGTVQIAPYRTARPDRTDHPPVVRIAGPYQRIFEPGSKVLLTWDSSDDHQIVRQRILFSAANNLRENFTVVIANNLPADRNSYEFTVPSVGFQASGSNAFVRVVAFDDKGQEGWDEWQAQIPSGEETGTLTITSPVAGQTFIAGHDVPLTWTVTQQFQNTSFEGFLVLGADDKRIGLGGGDSSGTFATPRMPYVSTDSARFAVRVYGSTNRQKWFYSAPFSIRPDPRWIDAPPQITLLSPAAGQQVTARGTLPISWTASDDDALRGFNLEASFDSGRTWQTVIKDLPATARSYTWPLPQNGGAIADARLRVIALDRRFQNSSEGQNRAFTILAAAPQAPRLSLARSGSNVTLSWLAEAQGYTLQSTQQLGPSATWSNVTPGPSTVGDEKVVTLPMASAKPFYRLLKP